MIKQPSKEKTKMQRMDKFLRRTQRIVRPIFVLLVVAIIANAAAGILIAPAKDFEQSLFKTAIPWLFEGVWYQWLLLVVFIVFACLLIVSEVYVYFWPDKKDEEFKDALVKALVGIHDELVGKIDPLQPRPSIFQSLQTIATDTRMLRSKDDLVKVLVDIHNELVGKIDPLRPSIFQFLQAIDTDTHMLRSDVAKQKELLDKIDPQQPFIAQHLQTIAMNIQAFHDMMQSKFMQDLLSNTFAFDNLKAFQQDIQLRSSIQAISTNTDTMQNILHQDMQKLQEHLKTIERNTTPTNPDGE